MNDRVSRWTAVARTGAVLGLIFLQVWTAACGRLSRESTVEPWPAGDASYDFDQPDVHVELPDELEEISGIAVMEDGRLAAVQDEDGILFVLDPSTGSIMEQRSFGEPGDYEALDIAEGRLFVLRSDGTLYRFDAWSAQRIEGDEIKLDLPRRCDAEGLRYDESDGWLLVACKENSGGGLSSDKATYAFDLDGRRVRPQPIHLLDARRFSASIEDHPVNESVRAVLSDRIDLTGFKPSELAVHPITGELFVLSSARAALVGLRRDGTVTGIWALPDSLLPQPEGLDFLPNGDLYLSSEAAGRKHAVLLRYTYRGSQEHSNE